MGVLRRNEYNDEEINQSTHLPAGGLSPSKNIAFGNRDAPPIQILSPSLNDVATTPSVGLIVKY